MAKNIKTIQAAFNMDDPYQRKLYYHVVSVGTTNKSDAAKRIFQRDMESGGAQVWKRYEETPDQEMIDQGLMAGLI